MAWSVNVLQARLLNKIIMWNYEYVKKHTRRLSLFLFCWQSTLTLLPHPHAHARAHKAPTIVIWIHIHICILYTRTHMHIHRMFSFLNPRDFIVCEWRVTHLFPIRFLNNNSRYILYMFYSTRVIIFPISKV